MKAQNSCHEVASTVHRSLAPGQVPPPPAPVAGRMRPGEDDGEEGRARQVYVGGIPFYKTEEEISEAGPDRTIS